MRIIHLAMGMPEFDHACYDLGHHHVRIDWGAYDYARRQAVLLDTVEHFKPDVVFMQLQTPDVIAPYTANAITKAGVMLINWTGDVRDPIPGHYIDMAPHVTTTCFTNRPDVVALSDMGYDARFLQIGYDPLVYNTNNRAPSRRVVFIGNDYGDRFPLSGARRDKVYALHRTFSREFTAYGKGFGKALHHGADAEVYKASLIAINLDHFHRSGFFSDRRLRARACGCYTIDGTAMTTEQLLDTVREALSNPEQTRELGMLQARKTFELDRWHNRIQTIEQWHATWS